jgi:flagellar hook-associated protein 2
MTSIYPSNNSSSSTSSAKLLKISGMASGIDTDAVVKSMVSNYQSKIDKENQGKQMLQWKQDSYRDIIKGVKALQDYFDPISSKYMLSGNSFNTNSVTNADNSIVSATSGSTAKVGTYKVNVQQLAEQAKIEGSSKNSLVEVSDLSKWSGKILVFGVESINLGVIGASSTIPTDTLMSKLATDINEKIATSSTLKDKISASYVNDGTNSYIKFTKSATAGEIKLSNTSSTVSDVTGMASDLTINSGITASSKLVSDLGFFDSTSDSAKDIKFKLTIGTTDSDISLAVSSNTTVQNLMDKVKSVTGGVVTMSIDDTTGKISFQSKNYGSRSSITIGDSSDPSTSNNVITKFAISSTIATGKDAIVAITAPGQSIAVTTTQSSNQFTVNDVSFNLTGVNAANETSNVSVLSSSDTVISNMKKFIEDYNTIVSTINTKLTEKKNNNYAPLTDEQKTSMSESQVTAWEAKAKVGILRKDDYLTNLMTQLRGTLYSPVYSDASNTSTGKVPLNFGSYGTGAIGIETSTDYTDGGKLVLKDETKLKDAIQNHMEDFKKLFIGSSSRNLGTEEGYIGSLKYKEDGIFKRMDKITREYVASPGIGKDGTYSLSGYMNIFVNKQYDFSSSGSSGKNTLPDQVHNKVLNASKFQTQLASAETRYYAKFTALEKAMNALNSQQSSLGAMLGNGG